MHVLTITPDAPSPATTGLHLRMVENLRFVREVATRTTLGWIATEDRPDGAVRLEELAAAQLADSVVCLGTRRPNDQVRSVRRLRAKLEPLLAPVTKRTALAPYSVRYDHIRTAAVELARQRQADVVVVPNTFLHWAPDFRSAGVRVVCDAADIVSDLVSRQRRAHPRGRIGDMSLQLNIAACRAQEKLGFAQVDEIWVTTPGEAQVLVNRGVRTPTIVIPNCVRPPDRPLSNLVGSHTPRRRLDCSLAPAIGMLGTYSYEPNLDAARMLVHEVLPKARTQVPNLECVIAGAGLSDGDHAEFTERGATVLGPVETIGEFYERVHITVLPIRTRGGLPLKVVEALAHSVAVVATPELIVGTPIRPNRDVLVEDDAFGLADAVVALLHDERLLSLVASTGRRAYDEHFAPARILQTLAQHSIVSGSAPTNAATQYSQENAA